MLRNKEDNLKATSSCYADTYSSAASSFCATQANYMHKLL